MDFTGPRALSFALKFLFFTFASGIDTIEADIARRAGWRNERAFMQLSLQSDYSLRVLIFLGLKQGERSSIEEIATAYQISNHHLVKVAHRLGKLGFIQTRRGRSGGLYLAHDPADIRVGEVVRQTENMALLECLNLDKSNCPISSVCMLKQAVQEATQAFFRTLDQYTLEDLLIKSESLERILKIKEKKVS